MLWYPLFLLFACLSLAFAVTPGQAEQVQLAWDAPLQANGTPFTTLAGYKLYYGSSSGNYQTVVSVGTTTTYTVTDLSAGQTYYFAVGAYSTTGEDGALSDELPVAIPLSPPEDNIIAQQNIKIVSVDSEDLAGGNFAAVNALDGNPATMWHTEWKLRSPKHPHTLVLDLGAEYQVQGFRYLPRQDGNTNGTIAAYEFYVSTDGVTWGTPVASGTLAANTTEKTVQFTSKAGRFVRLIALSEISSKAYTSAAELNILGTATATLDTDKDGLNDAQEAQLGTNPLLADTDGDGLSDGAEITTHLTSPLLADTDGDGRSDGGEITAGTDPLVAPLPPLPTTTASQHMRWEIALSSTKTYANPFTDVTVSVEYTKAGSPSIQGYGFWDGDTTFKLRQAFPETGTWTYKTTATNPADGGLHERQGTVEVQPYTGTNALYRHGFLQVSADQRFLEHADGTPFLWLGDTLWGATVWLTEAGFSDAVADRRAKQFTVLQTNFARKAEVDTAGDTPWDGDRWNVRFMQKLDRMFNDANDQGMHLFVNGLVDLLWERGITQYERLVEMIAIRYGAHYVSFASSMDDPYDAVHELINAAVQRVAPHLLITQHPGAAVNGQGKVWTAEQYYDTSLVDYVMNGTGVAGNLELACQNAIDWSQRLYNHVPPKPVVNGETWYEGLSGGTGEIAAHLGYLSLLSGNFGYTYGTSLWSARDADLPAWKAFKGATYMQYLYEFFIQVDGGRPLQPRHELVQNQATRYQDRMAVGVTADGLTYAAFLPKGGSVSLDLTALAGSVGVTWYNPFTGAYQDQGTDVGGAVRTFTSPFGASASALVIMAQESGSPSEELTAPVLGAWSFEEGTGSTVLDTSDGAAHGTILGTAKWVPGKVGMALEFDGSTTAVRIPPPNITTDTITFVAWVKGAPAASWAGIFYARDTVQSAGIHYNSARQLSYTWNDNSSATWGLTGSPIIPTDEWALVAVSIEPTKAVLYVVSESTGTQSYTNAIPHRLQTLDTEFFIGHDVLRSSRRFRGLIDEVRLFDGALTAEDIQILYNSER